MGLTTHHSSGECAPWTSGLRKCRHGTPATTYVMRIVSGPFYPHSKFQQMRPVAPEKGASTCASADEPHTRFPIVLTA